ncbi:protein of unknown function [Vibrio tapetis subsp. tapetis]|uniref:Transposase n=1 Tax=Vibrio tapetis subsp. tapetis TaxID=1671868 RepID=A0A2N8ZA05_9VIBR|nr:protein of unknown function [Vibrio tapetis subsp. tapetis]
MLTDCFERPNNKSTSYKRRKRFAVSQMVNLKEFLRSVTKLYVIRMNKCKGFVNSATSLQHCASDVLLQY